MLDAEEAAKEAGGRHQIITPEEMKAADAEGLIDEAHLTIFLTWWQLGGMEHPPTITEIAAMPASLRHDLLYLIAEFGRQRRTRHGRQANEAGEAKQTKAKSKAKRSKKQ